MKFHILAVGIKEDFLDAIARAMRRKQYHVVPTFSEGMANWLLTRQHFSLILANMALFIDRPPAFLQKEPQIPFIALGDPEKPYSWPVKEQAALFLPCGVPPPQLAAYAAAVLHPYNGHTDHPGSGVTGNWPIERGDFFVDRLNGWANVCGKAIALTPEELVMLVYFLSHPRLVLTSQMVCTVLWMQAYRYGQDETLLIEELRNKIEPDPEHPIYLQDVPDGGYWFRDTRA